MNKQKPKSHWIWKYFLLRGLGVLLQYMQL